MVLTARDSTDKFHPMCHIATTTFIAKRKFSWASVKPSELKVAKIAYDVRVAPGQYVRESAERTCIGIYSLKNANGLSVIAHIDPLSVYPHALTFDVGDGTNRRFPLCGPIPDDLGDEAVVAWRRLDDLPRLEREAQADRALFERLERQRLAEAREARRSRAAPNNSFKPKPLRGSA